MQHPIRAALSATFLAALLSACGGGGDDAGTPAPPASKFTHSATWTFTLPSGGGAVCFDFDAQAETAGCTGTAWDLKVLSSGRSASLWSNSGVSGEGAGGAFGGPFDRDWATLSTWTDARVDPVDGALPAAVYFADAARSVFTGTNGVRSAIFEYGLNGGHLMYPNYRVFLITTNSDSADAIGTPAAPVYALQVTGYYGGPGGTTSGFPSIRWIDRAAPGAVRTATFDAASQWVYVNLGSGQVVAPTEDWHIAFYRYEVKLNGGRSGSGQVAGFVGKTPEGFYDANGQPVVAQFLSPANLANTEAALNAADMATPARASQWVNDDESSALNAAYRGTYPDTLDYGWYRYHPTAAAATAAGLLPVAHLLSANPQGAALLRSGEGNSYARFHVTEIRYADPANASSAQTWTIAFDVQPAP